LHGGDIVVEVKSDRCRVASVSSAVRPRTHILEIGEVSQIVIAIQYDHYNMGASDSSQFDPGMLELFQAEMDTHIPVLNEGLLALERGEADAAQIEAMMRAAHSIKGAARIVGIPAAVQVAHVIEDCFTAAKDRRISIGSESVDVLLKGVDALQRLCNPAESAGVSGQVIEALCAAISAVRDGSSAHPTPSEASQAAVVAQHSRAQPRPVGATGELVAARVERDEPSVILPSKLDDASMSALRRELLDTLSLRPLSIQIDFSQLTQITAGGLAFFASFAAEASRSEPTPLIVCRGTSTPVLTVFRVAGLGAVFGLR
jgi:chemotaxis protein histidine kinase CheA